jgi:hypothetical protein
MHMLPRAAFALGFQLVADPGFEIADAVDADA